MNKDLYKLSFSFKLSLLITTVMLLTFVSTTYAYFVSSISNTENTIATSGYSPTITITKKSDGSVVDPSAKLAVGEYIISIDRSEENIKGYTKFQLDEETFVTSFIEESNSSPYVFNIKINEETNIEIINTWGSYPDDISNSTLAENSNTYDYGYILTLIFSGGGLSTSSATPIVIFNNRTNEIEIIADEYYTPIITYELPTNTTLIGDSNPYILTIVNPTDAMEIHIGSSYYPPIIID